MNYFQTNRAYGLNTFTWRFNYLKENIKYLSTWVFIDSKPKKLTSGKNVRKNLIFLQARKPYDISFRFFSCLSSQRSINSVDTECVKWNILSKTSGILYKITSMVDQLTPYHGTGSQRKLYKPIFLSFWSLLHKLISINNMILVYLLTLKTVLISLSLILEHPVTSKENCVS